MGRGELTQATDSRILHGSRQERVIDIRKVTGRCFGWAKPDKEAGTGGDGTAGSAKEEEQELNEDDLAKSCSGQSWEDKEKDDLIKTIQRDSISGRRRAARGGVWREREKAEQDKNRELG